VVAALVGGPLGCKASASAETSGGAKTADDFDTPIETPVAQPPAAEAPLLGARQDLTYKGSTSPNCSCLAVVLGQASDPAFEWSGKAPETDRESQLVIALTSNGVTCAATGAAGASYWGYEVIGQDVVVVVENAVPGRPVANGAIIPRPIGNGQVFVKPADKNVPYGTPPGGAAGDRCQIGKLEPAAAAESAPSTIESPSKAAPAKSESSGGVKAGASGGFQLGGSANGSIGTP
jgi:hypothetical protein